VHVEYMFHTCFLYKPYMIAPNLKNKAKQSSEFRGIARNFCVWSSSWKRSVAK